MGLFLIYSDYLFAENTLTSTRFCAYSASITDMNFRIRIFNFCTSNCTPYLIIYFRNNILLCVTPYF